MTPPTDESGGGVGRGYDDAHANDCDSQPDGRGRGRCTCAKAASADESETPMTDRYPVEALHHNEDDGTMPANVACLGKAVIGHRIVTAERGTVDRPRYGYGPEALILTLDSGTRVRLVDTADCCAFTSLEAFLLHPEKVNHVITGVGTTDEYTKWHIYADMGDVLELSVGWSCGNPFYYGYGFDIEVEALDADA